MPDLSPPPAHTLPRHDPWTVRVAAFSARHRWLVAALWLAFTLGLFGASLAVGGTDAVEAVSNERRSRYEAGEASVLFNASGREAPSQQLLLIVSSPDGSVRDPAFAAAIGDSVHRLTVLRSSVDGVDGPVVDRVVDPLRAPPQAGLVSADGTAARIVARVPGDGDELDDRVAPVPALVDELRVAHPDVRIDVLNSALANDEISELVNTDLHESLFLTIPLTFAILLLAFGAVVAAAVPLVLAATALLAAFGILGLYSRLIDPVSPYANQLVVLIGLAVAVDYSLFMITRFRSERRAGRDRLSAIHVASSTAGRAVFFSGVAVMISVAGLFMLDDPLFRSMAIGTIAVVLIAVVGSLTFLPAVLALLGDGVDRLRLPWVGHDRGEAGGVWAALVRRVMRRPVFWATVASLGLLALASPVLRLHLGQGDFTAFPDRLEAVRAIQLLDEKWPEGSTLELQVVVTRADEPATQEAIARLDERVLELSGVSPPARSEISVDGTVARVSYLMSGTRNDEANRAVVRDLRERVVPEVFGSLTSVRALVAGDAAYTLDVVTFYATGMPVVMVFVLGLSFVLLLVAFRSVVIPIKAILLNLLSTGAAYGLLVLVFQEGLLADVLGFKTGVVESFVPVFIFTVLFGLSMDYHVFILTRIKEARDRGASSNEAVAQGIAITSGTITSAAAIMVVVFAVFVTLELYIIKQLGFGLAVAVFLDATVVRCVLLPATMRLLGEWNWWFPRWLDWLPKVSIEAEPELVAATPELAPRPANVP
jgi:RND superfamily putative drug exporter